MQPLDSKKRPLGVYIVQNMSGSHIIRSLSVMVFLGKGKRVSWIHMVLLCCITYRKRGVIQSQQYVFFRFRAHERRSGRLIYYIIFNLFSETNSEYFSISVKTLFSKTGILNLWYDNLTDLLFSKTGILNLCYENLTDP